MYATTGEVIIFFVILCSVLILMLSSSIIWVVYKYQKKQNAYLNEITVLKAIHENAMLQVQIEIQEQTFQNISREIHDNVGQKLSLAKLQILNAHNKISTDLNSTANLITRAIADLRNLSRTLNSEIVLANGLIHALEFEIEQIRKTNLFEIQFEKSGEIVFIEDRKELIIFRIIQECLQNIVKHALAKKVSISIHFSVTHLNLIIKDNGKGFGENFVKGQGLHNMQARAEILGGELIIRSNETSGSVLEITIPIMYNATT